jgi:membrane protein
MFSSIYWSIVVVGMFVGSYLLFLLLFRFSPRFKIKWNHVHAGAITSSIPTALFVLLFSQITKIFLQYNFLGQYATFITLSMSISIISYFIYVGLIVNAVYYRTRVGKKTIAKKTVSKK